MMTRPEMIAAVRRLYEMDRPLAELISLCQDYRDRYGNWVFAQELLDAAGVPFGCSVIDTWNGGSGGRVSKFTPNSYGIGSFVDCVEWIHKNTPFSFYEATTNQGYEIEFFGES